MEVLLVQFKLPPENVEKMLDNGKFEVYQRSENQIAATKPLDFGKIKLRLKREQSRYSIEMHHHWLVNVHYEYGVRPQRDFDSKKVKEFSNNFVKPYAEI